MTKKPKTTELTDKDLDKRLIEKREELRKARFNVAGAKAKDVKHQRTIRREIASLLTEIQSRRNLSKLK